MKLSRLHHVAIQVKDLLRAIEWYQKKFSCCVVYQDDTWAMLEFENIRLALVMPSQHPAHLAVLSDHAENYGRLTKHRDGVRSVYIQDSEDNAVEILDAQSIESE